MEDLQNGLLTIESDAIAETQYWMNCRPYEDIKKIYKKARSHCRTYICKTITGVRYRPTNINTMFNRLSK